ncbi:MAG: hypothetical protein AB8B83_00265 [Bdellovibrionales bacterium]
MTDCNYDYFELRRLSDDLIYQFDRTPDHDGKVAYKRRDADLWITFHNDYGWVAFDEDTQSIMGRSWTVLQMDQGNHPPEGEWVSKKGAKSYVYELVYCAAP